MKKIDKAIKEKKMSKAEAKDKIRAALDKSPGMDELDLADKLCVSLRFACEVCDEMLGEGKIKRTHSRT